MITKTIEISFTHPRPWEALQKSSLTPPTNKLQLEGCWLRQIFYKHISLCESWFKWAVKKLGALWHYRKFEHWIFDGVKELLIFKCEYGIGELHIFWEQYPYLSEILIEIPWIFFKISQEGKKWMGLEITQNWTWVDNSWKWMSSNLKIF